LETFVPVRKNKRNLQKFCNNPENDTSKPNHHFFDNLLRFRREYGEQIKKMVDDYGIELDNDTGLKTFL